MGLKTFLINRITDQKFRIDGIIPSNRRPKKQMLCQSFRDHVVYSPQQLPHKVDLRSDMTPVEDQSAVGSCAANCLAGAYEYLTKKSDGQNTDVSRLFIYYNARAKDSHGKAITDSGCSMTSAIEALEEFGTCLESIWPYDISKVNMKPSQKAFSEAKSHTISDALEIDIDLDEMKSCLAQGFPFAFGMRLFKSFDKASVSGVVPMPNTSERTRASHGSHALLAVGYSDHSQSFIVRNSWGEHWGDKGYCYIPYAYMANSQLCFDAWAIRKLANDNFGREHWDIADSINYIKAAMMLLSQNNPNYNYNNNDDDNSCSIQQIDIDDGAYQRASNFAYGGQPSQYPGYQQNDYSSNTNNNYGGQQQYPNNTHPNQWPNNSGWARNDYTSNMTDNNNANANQWSNNPGWPGYNNSVNTNSGPGYQQPNAGNFNPPNSYSSNYDQQQPYGVGGNNYNQQQAWGGMNNGQYTGGFQPNNSYAGNFQDPYQGHFQGAGSNYGYQPGNAQYPTHGANQNYQNTGNGQSLAEIMNAESGNQQYGTNSNYSNTPYNY